MSCIWDADLWMFPALLVLHPEIAQSIIEYRFVVWIQQKRMPLNMVTKVPCSHGKALDRESKKPRYGLSRVHLNIIFQPVLAWQPGIIIVLLRIKIA